MSEASNTASVSRTMDIQALSPETIQDLVEETATPVPAEKIDETFKSDSIGKSVLEQGTILVADHEWQIS